MNWQRILLAPWLALPKLLRGIALTLWGFILLGMLIAVWVAPLDQAHSWMHGINALAFAQALIGAIFLAANAMVMRDVRQWCVPQVQRDIAIGVGVYAFASIVVPSLVLAWLGAPFVYTVLALTIGMCAGLLYSLGTQWLALPVMVLWIAYDWADLSASISPSVSWELGLTAFIAVAAVALVLWAWQRVLVSISSPRSGGLMAWVLGGYSSRRDNRHLPSTHLEDATQTWLSHQVFGRPDNGVDVSGAGPHDRVRSIRVALGGLVLPRNRFGLFVKVLPLMLASVGILLVVLWIRRFSPYGVSWWDGMVFIAAIILFLAMMMVIGQAGWLLLRWRKVDAELPLLALLPGLGDAATQRSNLLHAALGLPVMLLAGMLIISLGMAISGDFAIAAWLSLLLAECGFGAMTVAFVLNVLGGCSPSRLKFVCLFIAVLFLVTFSFIALQAGHGPNAFDVVLGVLWLTLGVIACNIGWRGWKALQQRPHPFLARSLSDL